MWLHGLILKQNKYDITNSVMSCSMIISKGATTDFMVSKNNVFCYTMKRGKGKIAFIKHHKTTTI